MRLFVPSFFFLAFSVADAQQHYPNIIGETLMEDDRVVVQRFVLKPGEWEGIHEHPEYQLVIVLNSTDELTFRFRGGERVFPGPKDGGVRELTAVDGDFVDLSAHDTESHMGHDPQTYVMIEGPSHRRSIVQTRADEARVAQFLTDRNMVFMRFPHLLGHYIGDWGEASRFTNDGNVHRALNGRRGRLTAFHAATSSKTLSN